MKSLRMGLPCLGWMVFAVAATFLATVRMAPLSEQLVYALVAGGFVFLVHLPGFRSRPWVRAVSEPVLTGAIAAGMALGAYELGAAGVRGQWDEKPAYGLLALVVFGPLLLRFLIPRAAGGRVLRLMAIEWRKLRKGRLLPLGFLLVVVVTLAVGRTYTPGESESGWSVAAGLLKSGMWMAEILLLVLGAVAIAGEVGQGTMKMILPHAYKRSDWVLAKGLVLSLVAIAFVGVIGLTSVGYAHFTVGLADVIKKGEPAFGVPDTTFQEAGVMASHMLETIGASAASLIALVWIALLFSALFSTVVPALSTAFLVFVALRFGNLLLGYSLSLQERLFTSFPEWMREATQNLGKGLNHGWNATHLPNCLWLCGLTILLTALASIVIFDRRELG